MTGDVPPLADLAELVTGFPFKSADFGDGPEGHRLLRGDNIGQGRLRWAGAKYWPHHLDGGLVTFELHRGDVVVAMDRPWIEAGLKYAVVREDDVPSLLVQRVARLRARDGVDQGFLGCLIGSRAFTDHVLSVQTGTTVPHISGSQLLAFAPPRLPSLPEQRAIAEVLGALDDKIESNRRIIATGLCLAQTEFTMWALGVEQWEDTTFGEFTMVYGGATPRTDEPEFWDGAHSWATPTDVTRLSAPYLFRTGRQITDAGLAASSTELHPAGTVFMTSRATIGAFAVNQVPCATNQGFIAVRPTQPDHRWFLFHEMERRVPEMLDRANGTTFREISRGSFKTMAVSVPVDPGSFRRLHDALNPVHERGAAAASESDELATLRDTLLPELLSGRLRVPVAEELVEAL